MTSMRDVCLWLVKSIKVAAEEESGPSWDSLTSCNWLYPTKRRYSNLCRPVPEIVRQNPVLCSYQAPMNLPEVFGFGFGVKGSGFRVV